MDKRKPPDAAVGKLVFSMRTIYFKVSIAVLYSMLYNQTCHQGGSDGATGCAQIAAPQYFKVSTSAAASSSDREDPGLFMNDTKLS
jgi:hypothetical protein